MVGTEHHIWAVFVYKPWLLIFLSCFQKRFAIKLKNWHWHQIVWVDIFTSASQINHLWVFSWLNLVVSLWIFFFHPDKVKTYFGNILYKSSSVFAFSAASSLVRSATMSSKWSVYFSIMVIIVSMMLNSLKKTTIYFHELKWLCIHS